MPHLSHQQITRGYGVLEHFLAQQRGMVANKLIAPPLRAGRLLDIGCGTYPLFLLKTAFAHKVGLDKHMGFRPSSISRDGNSTFHFVYYDVERGDRLPFQDNQFSVVSMLAVFEHIEIGCLIALLSDVKRIMKPGGQLILTTPTKIAHSVLRVMAKFHLVSPIEIAEHKTCLSLVEIFRVMDRAGFPSHHVTHGYFQLRLNQWVSAIKTNVHGLVRG